MEDDQELLRELFALATQRLEAAHEIAVEGQGAGLTGELYAGLARRLGVASRDVAILAAAITVAADPDEKTIDDRDRDSC